MQCKKKIFIITVPWFCAIAALSLFLLLPSITDIKNISQEIKDRKQVLLQKQLKGQNIQKNIDELSRVKKAVNTYSVFAPKENELEFIENLEMIAKKHYVNQDIKISASDENNEKKLKIIINSEGKFIDLIRYLHSLETQKYYLNIKSFVVNSDGARRADGEGSSVKNMKLSIIAYVYLR
ncbi:hypothetical protein KAS41_00350 [Candidatus Parcubacteria bacterium]|nr:hypothetical protein [Candidatus Parcubacteria bacterium]